MLRWRLVTGLLLLPVLLLAMFWHGWGGAVIFSLLAALFSLVAADEYLALVRSCGFPGMPHLTRRFAVLLSLAVGIGPLLLGQSPSVGGEALETLTLALFLVLGFRDVFANPDRKLAFQQLLISLSGLIYICWTLSFIPKLYFCAGLAPDGRWLVLFLVVVTKCGDIGAYAAGTLTARRARGNHKMVPALSPKKSWEGFAGGMASCIGAALLLVALCGERLTFHGVPVMGYASALFWGFFCAVLGLWGDLAESALKRAAGAKNSGLVPGFGGVLDVLDSLMLVSPFFYGYVLLSAG